MKLWKDLANKGTLKSVYFGDFVDLVVTNLYQCAQILNMSGLSKMCLPHLNHGNSLGHVHTFVQQEASTRHFILLKVIFWTFVQHVH